MKKKFPIETTLCYYFHAFDPKNHGFSIPEHLFGPLYHVCVQLSQQACGSHSRGVHCQSTVNIHVRAQKGYHLEEKNMHKIYVQETYCY